jgi:hypothetical protein
MLATIVLETDRQYRVITLKKHDSEAEYII